MVEWLRSFLIALLTIYQRHVSGRGLLANVRCTFGETESCSTYGLRMVRRSESLGNALGLIIERLSLCGRISIYLAHKKGHAVIICNEAIHREEPRRMARRMLAGGERRKSVAVVLAALAKVASFRRDRGRVTRAKELLRRLGQRPPRVLIRNGRAFLERFRTHRSRRRWFALVVGVASGLLIPHPAGWLAAGIFFAVMVADRDPSFGWRGLLVSTPGT